MADIDRVNQDLTCQTARAALWRTTDMLYRCASLTKDSAQAAEPAVYMHAAAASRKLRNPPYAATATPNDTYHAPHYKS